MAPHRGARRLRGRQDQSSGLRQRRPVENLVAGVGLATATLAVATAAVRCFAAGDVATRGALVSASLRPGGTMVVLDTLQLSRSPASLHRGRCLRPMRAVAADAEASVVMVESVDSEDGEDSEDMESAALAGAPSAGLVVGGGEALAAQFTRLALEGRDGSHSEALDLLRLMALDEADDLVLQADAALQDELDERDGSAVGPRASADLVWSTASLRTDLPLLKDLGPSLADVAHRQLHLMDPSSLCRVTWAITEMRDEVPELYEKLLPRLSSVLLSMPAYMLSEVPAVDAIGALHAIAKLKDDAPALKPAFSPLLLAIARGTIEGGDQTPGPKDVSKALWAIAELQDDVEGVKRGQVERVGSFLARRLEADIRSGSEGVLDSESVVNGIYAAAVLPIEATQLEGFMAVLKQEASRIALELDGPQVHTLVGSAVSFRDRLPEVAIELLKPASEALQASPALAKQMTSQMMAATVWGAGTLAGDSEVALDIFDGLEMEITNRLGKFRVPEIGLLSLGLALLENEDGAIASTNAQLLKNLEQRFVDAVPKATPQVFSVMAPRVVWACDRFGKHDGVGVPYSVMKLVADKFMTGMADRGDMRLMTLSGVRSLLYVYETHERKDDFFDFRKALQGRLQAEVKRIKKATREHKELKDELGLPNVNRADWNAHITEVMMQAGRVKGPEAGQVYDWIGMDARPRLPIQLKQAKADTVALATDVKNSTVSVCDDPSIVKAAIWTDTGNAGFNFYASKKLRR